MFIAPGFTWAYWLDSSCSGGTPLQCIGGWKTTDNNSGAAVTARYIEVALASTYGAFGAQNNRIVAELNASMQSRLYQPICLQAGETVTMNYYFSPRNTGANQQVAAGLWSINDPGPIGNALSAQNSTISSTVGFTPQTAVFTAPGAGLYQIGLEAVLPPTGSNGNVIDDISVLLKPLIDLNTQATFDMPEGDVGPSIQLRINGTVQTPTTVVIKKVSGVALPDIDFTLGTPVGLAGTTPTISHSNLTDEWTVTIPPGEYDAGQGMFGNAKYGIAIPIQSEYDVLRESTEPLTFELQNPGYSGTSDVTYWDKTNPICEGATTNSVTYNIVEVRPKLRVHKNVINRVHGSDQFTTIIKDDAGNVVSSTSASATSGGGVTTTGAGTGLFSAAGTFEADFGTPWKTYTITEVMAPGSVNTLSAYTTSISCTNARVVGGSQPTVLPSGVGQTFTVTVKDSDNISCTLTNAPLPKVTLFNKALGSTRAAPNDQFTLQVLNGASVVNPTTGSTTGGSGNSITAGTGEIAALTLQPYVTYTLREVGAGSPVADLSLYNTVINCTNAYSASTTVLPSGAQTGAAKTYYLTPGGNDDISCTLTNIAHQPRVTLNKALTVGGRLNALDQFTVQIKDGASVVTSGTTSGSGNAVSGGVAGPEFLSAGVLYTLTEVMTGGSVSPLSAYNTRISCTNQNGSSSTILPSGTGQSFPLTPQLDDVISCTLTNGNPRIQVNKTVTSLWDGNDRFTTQIRTGGAGGTVVSGTTASTSTGGGVLTTGGAGTYTAPGHYLGLAGTTYTLTEAISGGTGTQANYSTSISCTNANGGSSTVLPSGTGVSFTLTPQFNDDIDCTITNIAQPRISLTKALASSRANDSDEFLIRLQGGAINTTSTTAGTGATITAGTGTIAATQVVAGTTYTLSEVMAGGSVNPLTAYNNRISCTNSFASSATPLPSGSGTSFTVTPQLGDDIACTITNDRLPRLRVNKVIATGLVDPNDRFTTYVMSGSQPPVIFSSTSSDPQTGGAVTTTGGVGTYNATGMTVVTAGTTYRLTEDITSGSSGMSQYDTTIACTNSASGSATTLPSGSGQSFNITPATGDNITCTLTNSPKTPLIRLNKKVSGLINASDRFTTQIKSGAAVVSSTTASPGGAVVTGAGTGTYTVAGAFNATPGTAYTLTEVVSAGPTPLGNYSTAITCSNTRSDGPFTMLPNGEGNSFPLTVQYGDNITCQLDNGPAAITLNKAMGNSRLVDTDEFRMEIRNSGGTVLNSLISATTAGQLNVVTPGSGTTGITYVPGGATYTLTETAAGGTTLNNYHTSITCTNATAGSPTVLPSQAYALNKTFTVTPASGDDITCTMSNRLIAPKITLRKALGGQRYAAGDQFSLQVRDAANTTTLASATTTGTGATVANGSVVYAATAGTTYTLREIAATGSLANYVSAYSCINNRTGVTTTGTATSFSFTAAQSDDLDCTFTNAPRPRLIVNKVIATGRVSASDQFTTEIRTGGASGTIVSSTGSSTTTGGGVLTTGSGAGTFNAPGSFLATGGTVYTLTESISGSSTTLAQYQTAISCTNANAASSTVLPSGTSQPFDVTIQNGDLITCTLTNTPHPRLRVNKTVTAAADTADRFTTRIRTGGVSGTVVSATTANPTTGGGVVTAAATGSFTAAGSYQAAAGTTYTLTEDLTAGPSDISQYGSAISCSNSYAGSTTELPTGAYPFEVTPQLGDNISCTFTNTTIAPRIRVHKTVASLVDANDRFTTELRTGGSGGTVVSTTGTSGTVGGGVLTGSGTGSNLAPGVYQAAIGTTYSVTESLSGGTSSTAQYNTVISCVNARAAGPATSLPSGATPPFDITPKSGDDISCTLTNAVKPPVLTLRKDVAVRIDGADQFTLGINGGSVSQTATTTGSATGIQSVALNSVTLEAGTAYTLSETKAAGASALNLYKTELVCSNARGTGPATTMPSSLTEVVPTGGPLTSSYVITPRAGDVLTCTWTNSKQLPKLRVNKTVGSLVDANDRFTTEIRTGGSGGAVVSGTGASATTGGGVLTTGGVATYNAPGTFVGVEGTAYTLTESISAGTSSTQQYTTTVSCTNAFTGSATVLPVNAPAPYTLTPQLGDDISCTLTNVIKPPVLRVNKTVVALANPADRLTTQIRTGGVSGPVVSDTSASATTGGGVLTTGGVGAYTAPGSYVAVAGTTYTLTEVLTTGPSNIAQYRPSVSCVNSRAGATTVLPAGETQPFSLTPVAGDNITCTISNEVHLPSVTVSKISTGSTGSFTFTATNLVTGSVPLTTVTDGVAVSSAEVDVTTRDADVTLTETVPSGWTLSTAACTDANSAVTGNPASFGSLAGNTLTIPGSNVLAAADIRCTFTNRKSATLILRKSWVNALPGDAATVATAGAANNATLNAVADTATETDSAAAVTVFAGETLTFSESFTTGDAANYTATLACTGAADTNLTNGLTVNAADSAIVCTQTNSRIAKNLTLRKSWVNARTGDAVDVTATGLTPLSSVADTASETDDGAVQTVYAGDVLTLGETFTTGNAAHYTSSLACTGSAGLTGDVLTVGAADGAIVCTRTNSRIAKTLTLQKTWVNAQLNDAVTVTANGLPTFSAVASTANETDVHVPETVYAGDAIPIAETFTTGSAANYTVALACSGNTQPLAGNILTVDPADSPITCTLTNTRKSAQLTLVKTWVNGKAGDTVALESTGFGTNAFVPSVSSGNNSTSGAPVTVFAGETGSISEIFAVGSPANYTAALACSGNAQPLSGSGLTIDPADTAITCTMTNTRKSATLTLVKTWNNAIVGDAVDVSATGLTPLNSVADTASETDTAPAQTVYAGDAIVLAEVHTVGSGINYDSTLSCSGNTLPLTGNTLTVDPADTAITCTHLNERTVAHNSATLTLRKIWTNANIGDTVQITATGASPLTPLVSSANTADKVDTGASQLVYDGDTITLAEAFTVGNPAEYTGTLSCTGNNNVLTGNVLTVDPADTAITCTFVNALPRKSVSGRVFIDNGSGGGAAHGGLQSGGEPGLASVNIRLTDCGGTVYGTAVTDGLGDYNIRIPNALAAGTTLCVEELPLASYFSVSGVAGDTGGSYSLVEDRTQFTLAATLAYTGVNFGNVPESTLTGVGMQSTAPGTTVEYAHVFTAGTAGAVTFSTAQNPSPVNPDWSSLLYRDLNCNGAIDPGDTAITAAITVTAGQVLCLVQKVVVPVTTVNGHLNVSTVSASFAFATPSVIVRPYSQNDQTTVIDNGLGLTLVKTVRQVGSCPSTGADTNTFGTSNDAPPGGYLEYRIVYANQSQGVVKDVTISDATPAFTLYRSASCTSTPSSLLCQVPSSGSGTAPVSGGTGNIQWLFTNNPVGLGGGQSGEVRFCVQVEQ